MMTLQRVLVTLFALVSLWNIADAHPQESLSVRIFNSNYRPSDDQLMALLKQADLQSHGYKKEVTMKLVSEPGSDKPRYEKTYYIHKIVDCLRLQEVVQELQYLLPDAIGEEIIAKSNKEIETKDLSSMKSCKVGVEVHFKESMGCIGKTSETNRRKRAAGCWICGFCLDLELSS